MVLYITYFIVALILALLVLAWIAYCMFVKEKHKSELYHHNISDIRRRQIILGENEDETLPAKKEVGLGIIVLPSRHKQKDEDYDKRPDYPESPVPISHPSTDRLIEMLNDGHADLHYKDGIYQVDSPPAPYDSEV